MPFLKAIIGLVGDSGYALSEWLIRPVGAPPANEVEENFNKHHKRMRRLIECFEFFYNHIINHIDVVDVKYWYFASRIDHDVNV